eukprot:12086354-Heterocapsa_arctica.AAC.1
MGIAISQIEDEVHFDTVIYGVWCQESDPRSTLTEYLQCLVPGERPEVHFDWLFTVFGARDVKGLRRGS